MILEGDLQREWRPDEPRYSRMVFIGRNLDRAELQKRLRSLHRRRRSSPPISA
jgi:G3E family GTPase